MFVDRSPGAEQQADWGVNWTDFPVMNLHPHAWPLYSAVKLLGLEFHEAGLRLAPALPLEDYEFSSTLLGFRKSAKGYAGWYAPAGSGRWTIEIALPKEEAARFKRLEVNGSAQPVAAGELPVIRITGDSAPEKPLRWVLS